MAIFSKHKESDHHGTAHWFHDWRVRLRARKHGDEVEIHVDPDDRIADELLLSLYDQGAWGEPEQVSHWWEGEEDPTLH